MRLLVDVVGGSTGLSRWIACTALGAVLGSAAVYLQVFATEGAQQIVSRWQLDKAVHGIGGVWLAMLAGLLLSRCSLLRVLGIVLAVSFAWEAYEFFLDWRTIVIYGRDPVAWAMDTALDTAFALVGGLAFHCMRNHPAQAPVPAFLEQG